MASTRESTAPDAFVALAMETLIAAPGVAPGTGLSFAGSGLAVTPGRLDEAARPTASGSEDAGRLSTLCNTIPPAAGAWSAEGESLVPLYRAWLDHAVFPVSALDDGERSALAAAMATVERLGGRYREAEARYEDARRSLDQSRRSGDFQGLRQSQAALARAMGDWQAKGGKARFETARGTMSQHAHGGHRALLEELRKRYDRALAALPPSSDATRLPARLAFSASFDSAGWSRCAHGSETAPAPPAPASLALWTRSREGAPPVPFPASVSRVEFDLLRVPIDRSRWFDDTWLRSRRWWWPGASRTQPASGGPLFSDGAPPPFTRGRWPWTPVEVLFVRDVTLDVTEGDDSLARFAAHARREMEAGLGVVVGRRSTPSLLAGPFDFELERPTRVRFAQPQIVAWACQRMPAEPDPDPALLPE